jgi:hypothetical protein
MTDIEELAAEELGRKINSIKSIKSLPIPAGEKECKYLSPGLPVNTTEFPYRVACGHNFIDHPPSNATAEAINKEMQREYPKTMDKITAWRANKKGFPQPQCQETGKLLTKVSSPELMKKHISHCSKIRANWHTGATCPNNCEGYAKGKCLICHCTCSLYVTEEMYQEIFILASIMSKDGVAEMSLLALVQCSIRFLLRNMTKCWRMGRCRCGKVGQHSCQILWMQARWRKGNSL